jgi:hypothetical protein
MGQHVPDGHDYRKELVNRDALAGYETTLMKNFAVWLKTKQQVYAGERRFPHTPFWQQRQGTIGSGWPKIRLTCST